MFRIIAHKNDEPRDVIVGKNSKIGLDKRFFPQAKTLGLSPPPN
jgi:hypothetical protein